MEAFMQWLERGMPGVFIGGVAGGFGGMLALAQFGAYWTTGIYAIVGMYIGLVSGGVVGGMACMWLGRQLRRVMGK